MARSWAAESLAAPDFVVMIGSVIAATVGEII